MVLVFIDRKLALPDPSTPMADAVNIDVEVVLDGTTTRVPLFQDEAGATPLAQPIYTGARGFTQSFYAQVDTLTTRLAWRSGGLQGGRIYYENYAAELAQRALDQVPNGVEQLDDRTVVLTRDGTPVTGPIALPTGRAGEKGNRGPEGPYGGTQVTDPQVASMLTDGTTASGAALSAKVYQAGEPLFTVLRGLTPLANPAVTAGAIDIAPIVQAALATAPAGSIIRIPEGTYVSRGRITPPKGVTLWGYGVKIIQDAAGIVFDLVGGFDATHAVATLAETSVTLENGNVTPAQQLTINSEIAETWARGDVVQLFADDWIPGSRPGSGATVTAAGAVTFSAATGIITTASPHTLNVGDGVYITAPSPSGTTSGVFDKQRYYVKSVPSATTFTVSETFNGPALTIAANGTATRIAKATTESRVGQHLRVLSFTKGGGLTTIVLSGKLNDPMTANVRVARFTRQARHQLFGFDLERSAALIEAGNASAMIRLTATLGAKITDVTVERNGAMAILTAGTYETTVDGVSTGWAWDDSATHFGYGVLDNASSFLTLRNCRFNGVRHGYSDDTERVVAGFAEPAKYGRSFANKVIDSTAINSSSSGWDTHHCSLGVEFVNVTAVNCWAGIGLRGRKHVVRNLTVRGAWHGLWIFTEPSGGDSWGHDVDGVYLEDVIANGVHVSLNEGVTADNPGRLWGRRETRRSRLRNVFVKSAARPLSIVNATVTLDGFGYDVAESIPDDNVNALFHNCSIEGTDWLLDFSRNVSGASVNALQVAAGSVLDVASIRMKSALGSRFARLVQSAGAETVRVGGATLDEMPTVGTTGGLVVGSFVNFHVLGTGESSSFSSVVGSQVTATSSVLYTRLARTTDDYTGMVNPSVASTLAVLPAGRRLGQRLDILNIGAAATTVKHGVAGNTSLVGSNDVVLTTGQTLRLVWAGSTGGNWRQVV